MSVGIKARASQRASFSAAFVGASIGLGLGAIFLVGGLNQAVSDHVRAARIAQQAGGGLSETMLQREINRLDPAALMLARAHDALTAVDPGLDLAQAWPGRFGSRFPTGRHASAMDNARDLDCLTEAVYFEARGEPARGQAAVAQVVLNRVASPSFPKSVCGVVFQGAASRGCQFSFACDGSMRQGLEVAAWDRARQVAERALAGVAAGGIGNATHFHTVDVQPYWTPQMLRVAQVGLHIFYRVNPRAAAIRPEMDRAVMTSLPAAPATNLRLASALLEKTADVTPPSPPKSEPTPAKAAVPAARPAELAGPSTSADSAAF